MVVFLGRKQYTAMDLLLLFIPVNQSRILTNFIPPFVLTFQPRCLMGCKSYSVLPAIEFDNFY